MQDFLGGFLSPLDDISDALNQLGLVASEGFENYVNDTIATIDRMTPAAEALGASIDRFYQNVKAQDWDAISDSVSGSMTSMKDSMVASFEDPHLMDNVGQFAASIVNGIGDYIGSLTAHDFEVMMSGMITGIETFVTTTDWVSLFEGVRDGVVNAFSGIGTAIWNKVKSELGL